MIWRATCWRATPDDPCGTKIAVQVALEILEDAFWNTKKKYSGPEMSHQDFHASLRYGGEKMPALIGGKHPSIPAWHLLMPGLRLPRRGKWLIVKAVSSMAITCYKSRSMEFSVKKDWWLLSSFRSICEGRVSVPQSVFSGQPCEHALDGSSCTSLQEQSEAEKVELLKKLKAEA